MTTHTPLRASIILPAESFLTCFILFNGNDKRNADMKNTIYSFMNTIVLKFTADKLPPKNIACK